MRRFRSSGLFQKLKDINYKNVIYVLLIYASIILSLVFGQINNANNGAFGNGMNEWQTILFYFFILTLYGVSFFIAYRNKIIQFNKKTIITIGIMGAVLIYFVFLNLFSDFSYILTEMGYQNKDPITVLMRIQGILDVSLSLLMTYSFLFLIPQIYPKNSHVKLVSYFVIFFTLVASIYSLATEIDTYKTMLESFDFISKERRIGCLSFFTYANVFGHLHLFCIIAIFLLSIVHKKKWIMIFSLINVLFIYFSGCRGALLAALFFYLFSIIYLIIVRFKDKKFVRATIATTFISAFICIVIGVVFGFIMMLAVDPGNAFSGLGVLLSKGFSSMNDFSSVLRAATPMMLTGLSIAVSYKLGMFNIGITGQVTAGAFVGICLALSGWNWFFCLLFGAISGGLIGFISGIMKAKLNVNEVLSGIMLNWIVYYLIGVLSSGTTGLIPASFKDRNQMDYFATVPTDGRVPSIASDILPGVTYGLIIAIILIIIMQFVMTKTTFGFELRASGTNKHAASYAGISQTKSIVLALTISGAIGGLAGYIIYANADFPLNFLWNSNSNTLIADGFTGISVSLIGQNSPIGCILSSIIIAFITQAQTALINASPLYNIHYTELIKAVIIYVASFSSFFNIVFKKWGSDDLKNFFNPRALFKIKHKEIPVTDEGPVNVEKADDVEVLEPKDAIEPSNEDGEKSEIKEDEDHAN